MRVWTLSRRRRRRLGQPLNEDAAAGMQAWLADHPQGKFGKHSYELAEFGLSEQQVSSEFADYVARFDVEEEQ